MTKIINLSEDEVLRNNRAIYSKNRGVGKAYKKIHNAGVHPSDCSCRSCRRFRQQYLNRLNKKQARNGQ
jgi:hypothetical protein